MLKNTKVLAAAFIGVGMLLGYAAASGKLNPSSRGPAALPPASGQASLVL